MSATVQIGAPFSVGEVEEVGSRPRPRPTTIWELIELSGTSAKPQSHVRLSPPGLLSVEVPVPVESTVAMA